MNKANLSLQGKQTVSVTKESDKVWAFKQKNQNYGKLLYTYSFPVLTDFSEEIVLPIFVIVLNEI